MTDEDGIQLDTYIDRLLAGPDAGPAAVEALPDVEDGMAQTATRLRAELVRFHPSFRFEERLSRRLFEVADAQWRGVAGARHQLLRPVALVAAPGAAGSGVSGASAIVGGGRAGQDDRHRGLLVGGAIASGVIASGVSLAGAGIVAWRRTRALHRLGRLI